MISIYAGVFVLGMVAGALVVACTDIGPWILSVYARAHGGAWHQRPFLCPGCNQNHHVGRPGPTGQASCVHCAPEPRQSGGAR